MVSTMIAAATRAVLIAILVILPALIVPEGRQDSLWIVAFISLILSSWVLLEYSSTAPVMLAYRFASPFNKIRFGFVFAAVLCASIAVLPQSLAIPESLALARIGALIDALSFGALSAELARLAAQEHASIAVPDLAAVSGLVSFISLLMVAVFYLVVKVLGWPHNHAPFNLWENLPNFEPTAGGEIVKQLARRARVNLIAALLMLALTPVLRIWGLDWFGETFNETPILMIWVITAWFFMPGFFLMHAIACLRIAALISEQRREALLAQERSYSLA